MDDPSILTESPHEPLHSLRSQLTAFKFDRLLSSQQPWVYSGYTFALEMKMELPSELSLIGVQQALATEGLTAWRCGMVGGACLPITLHAFVCVLGLCLHVCLNDLLLATLMQPHFRLANPLLQRGAAWSHPWLQGTSSHPCGGRIIHPLRCCKALLVSTQRADWKPWNAPTSEPLASRAGEQGLHAIRRACTTIARFSPSVSSSSGFHIRVSGP